MSDTGRLRVYVGTQDEQMLPFRVLAYSIGRHSAVPVEVLPLHQEIERATIEIPLPRATGNVAHTPFSFQRFAIPELNEYRGRVIYLDSDMVVFRGIHELLDLADPGAAVSAANEPAWSGRKSQISVMVLDCARLDWDVRCIVRDLDAGLFTYRQLYSELPVAPDLSRCLPHWWNDLERYTAGSTALTHFTDMETQPWLDATHPLATLWCGLLLEAAGADPSVARLVYQHVERGWVRPSLAYQVKHGMPDTSQLPVRLLREDRRCFTPPHRLGIVARPWAQSIAARATSYGKLDPGLLAIGFRRVQAQGYRLYKRLRAQSLNARV